MSKKLYFKNRDDEKCYPLNYFKWLLDYDNLDEITVYEAQPQDIEGFFWCREYEEAMDKNEGGCGLECKGYFPRNGIKGCCKHYSLKFYEPTDKYLTIRK